MRSDIIPGGTFPDYSLPDHTGTVRALSELQGRDPLVLVLSRGHFCPKEHQRKRCRYCGRISSRPSWSSGRTST